MTVLSRLFVFVCLLEFLHVGISAQSQQEPEMEAKLALQQFMQAWNSADNSLIQATVNYPHVTHAPVGLIIANQAEEFVTDFEVLKGQGWASSRFDKIITRQSSAEKVNFEVEYSRLNTAGEVYSRGYVFYVVTLQDGHWGMQYRAPGELSVNVESPEQRLAREQVLTVIDEFFLAFNAADNTALLKTNHVPQLMLNAGRFIYAESIQSPIVNMNFDSMRERENWNNSTLADFQILNVTPRQVIVELSFERFNPVGEKYLTGPAVWVLSQREDRWGVEFRSLMPSIRHSL